MSYDHVFDNSAIGGNNDTIHDDDHSNIETKQHSVDGGILEMQVLTDRTERDI